MPSEIEVVISGIGANFQDCPTVQDLGRNLLDSKYLMKPTKKWKYDPDMGVPNVSGSVVYEYFDDVFYGINRRLAKHTDPVTKMGYLRSFEAVLDAGMHPHSMRGANVGVFSGCGMNEFEGQVMDSDFLKEGDGYAIMGLSRTMLPNRISYFFDFTGPSCGVDSSWAVAHVGLHMASQAIRNGECNAALFVASNIVTSPQTSANLKRMGFICDDSRPKSFDANASGSVRSGGCVALFLQRADEAKRCYAKVLAANAEYTGPGSRLDISLPNPVGIRDFLTKLYRENDIDPKRVAYLEADGMANVVRDECEIAAIDAALVQGRGRESPLVLGSVQGNVGHSGCVHGLASVCKAVVAMETGTVPATLGPQDQDGRRPNPRAGALVRGAVRVAAANAPLRLAQDDVVAVNTMGITSMVGHTVLQPGPARSDPECQRPDGHLPRLVTLSARTEDGIREVVGKVQAAPFDTNWYRLVQDVFSPDIRGYSYRSYVICPAGEGEVFPTGRMENRTVWFVYSGMGSQWAGMGAGLMRLPIFAETIERLHVVLEPKGVDLKTVLTETGPQAFNNILKSFVGITACQIALTNVLKAVGVQPQGILGHSVGELGCAYADGCLTEEQAIVAAWARGVASNQATLIKGMMAAIGLGYKDILPRLPPSIDVACHNSDSSCTLSGPAEDVQQFVKQLTAEGVFARAVNVSDIAYHSRYIQPAGPFLREQLEHVIPEPKARSSIWVTTSVPEDQRDTDLAKYCSVAYLTNNLLSPVLFEEGLRSVPEHALLIEVAPHGLLQAILKRAMPEAAHVALAQREHKDPVRCLLHAIGK